MKRPAPEAFPLPRGALGARCLFSPTTGHPHKFVSDLGPIVQRRRIEVRAIGPGDCADLFVERHCIEHAWIL